MIVYDGLKTDFLSSCERDSIAIEIEENILAKLGKHTPKAEFRSWENSLNYMYKVLNDDAIPADAGIAIEFNIPQTSKRVDFMISGYGPMDDPEMVIVELKQWDALTEVKGTDALVEGRWLEFAEDLSVLLYALHKVRLHHGAFVGDAVVEGCNVEGSHAYAVSVGGGAKCGP